MTTARTGAALRILRRDFFRQVAAVASGTFGAQIISIAFTPVVSRLYAPEAFGIFGSFSSIVAVIAPVAALGFPIAVVLPKDDEDALGLAWVSILASALVSIVVLLFSLGFKEQLGSISHETLVHYLPFLLPVVVFFSGCFQTGQNWLIRKKRFGTLGRYMVASSLIVNCMKCAGGVMHPTGMVLVGVGCFDYLFRGIAFLNAARQAVCGSLKNVAKYSVRRTLRVIKEYRDFPLYRAPQDLINAGSQGLPLILIASLYSAEAAGFYLLARMVAGLPSVLVGKAVGDVFYPRISEAKRSGKPIFRDTLRATIALFVLGVIPFGALMIGGPFWFEVVFGSNWGEAGKYAQWLSVFWLLNFTNKSCVAVVPVVGIQKGLLIYECFSAAAKIAALVVGLSLYGSALRAVALLSVVGALGYVVLVVWVLLEVYRVDGYGKTGK